MSYCSNCGGRLNDNGQCPNCGGVSETKITPEEKETTEVLGCLKAFFSESPLRGVEWAARTRSASIWVSFGSLYMVTSIMVQIAMLTSFPPNVLHGMLDKDMEHAMERAGAEAPEKIMPAFVSLLGYAAAMSLLALIVVTVMTWLLFLMAREKPSFTQALNITTFSALPLCVCFVIGIPLSILSVPFALGLLLMGFAVSVVMYYFGIQKASEFEQSPFWGFVLGAFISELLLGLGAMVFAMLIF